MDEMMSAIHTESLALPAAPSVGFAPLWVRRFVRGHCVNGDQNRGVDLERGDLTLERFDHMVDPREAFFIVVRLHHHGASIKSWRRDACSQLNRPTSPKRRERTLRFLMVQRLTLPKMIRAQ